jgi:glucose/mannose-6-phosphate isomerase
MNAEFDETVLADADRLDAVDRVGVLRAIAGAGASVRIAQTIAASADLSPLTAAGRPRSLIIVTTGADGDAGTLVPAVAGINCPVPIALVSGAGLPGWVGPLDLVMVCCATGQEPASAACLTEAGRRGCPALVCCPADTPLAGVAAQVRAVHLAISGPSLPGAGYWQLAALAVRVAADLGVLPGAAASLPETADVLDGIATTCRPSQVPFVNPAKDLALAIAGGVTLIWGATPLVHTACRHFAHRLGAFAGHPAQVSGAPVELDSQLGLLDGPFAAATTVADIFHDPFEDPPRGGLPRLIPVLFAEAADEQAGDPPWFQALNALLTERPTPHPRVLRPTGTSALAKLASLIALSDFAAAYLALLVGKEPTAAPAGHELRGRIVG